MMSPTITESHPNTSLRGIVRSPYGVNFYPLDSYPQDSGCASGRTRSRSNRIFTPPPYGGAQKIRGRSPVPPAGSIIEPHTDIFPDIFPPLSALRNLSVKFSGGVRGLNYFYRIKVPYWYHEGYVNSCVLGYNRYY